MDNIKTLYRIEIKSNEFCIEVDVKKNEYKYEELTKYNKVWKHGPYYVNPDFIDEVDSLNPEVSYVSSKENIKPTVSKMFSYLIREQRHVIQKAEDEIKELEKSFRDYMR